MILYGTNSIACYLASRRRHIEPPASLGRGRRLRRRIGRRGREGDGVRPRLLLEALGEDRLLARADERRGHRRGPHDLVRELALPLGEAVAVRRDNGVGRRRVDPVVHELESVRGRSLAARVGRAVQQCAVERQRRGAAAVERGAGDGAEPDERLCQLEVRHPDAVAGAAAVGDHEQDPSVGELADTRPRGARRQLARREGLVGAEDRAAAADEHRAAADGVRDTCPLRPEDEPQRQLGSDRRLLGEPRRGGAARNEHRAVTGDRRAARAATWTTGPNRSVFGVAGGNGAMTTSVVPDPGGVVAP